MSYSNTEQLPFCIRLRDGSSTTTHTVVGHVYRDVHGRAVSRYRLHTGDHVTAAEYEIVADRPTHPLCDQCGYWLGRHRHQDLRLCEKCWESEALLVLEQHTSALPDELGAAVRLVGSDWIDFHCAFRGPDHTSDAPLIQSFLGWLVQNTTEGDR